LLSLNDSSEVSLSETQEQMPLVSCGSAWCRDLQSYMIRAGRPQSEWICIWHPGLGLFKDPNKISGVGRPQWIQ
jgi:hypothetical protein